MRIFAVAMLLLAAPAAAQLEQSPGSLGLELGAPEQEVFLALQEQGFSLKPGGERPHIRGSRDLSSICDYILVVTPENGSIDIWHRENVLLGFSLGRLVFTSEVIELRWEEAELAYSQILADWSGLEELEVSQEDPSRLGREGMEVHRDFYSLVWFLPIGTHFQSDQDRLRAARSGKQVFLATLRPAVKTSRRGSTHMSRSEGVIVVTYLDYCDLPRRDIYHFNRPDEERSAIACDLPVVTPSED